MESELREMGRLRGAKLGKYQKIERDGRSDEDEFRSDYSTIPFLFSSTHFCSSVHEKQLRNREIARPSSLY